MTATSDTDPTMSAITTAVALGRDGDTEAAKKELLAIWADVGALGDPLHRYTLAHYLADLYPDPAAALIWDVRALDAATPSPTSGPRRTTPACTSPASIRACTSTSPTTSDGWQRSTRPPSTST